MSGEERSTRKWACFLIQALVDEVEWVLSNWKPKEQSFVRLVIRMNKEE